MAASTWPAWTAARAASSPMNTMMDNYGTVVRAEAGGEGTNITDATLWNEARKAAMKASFNTSAEAPAMQKGTITYIFKITK